MKIDEIEYKVGDRVEVTHYAGHPPFKGYIQRITKHNTIWVKLDIGGFKESYPPLVKHCN